MMRKRFNSPLYTEGRFGKRLRETRDEDNQYLYSKGIYPTKIKKEELPEDYIRIMSRTHWYLRGYLKTSEIVDMKYEMRKINHLFKDDYLYISYHEPLRKEQITRGYSDYVNYDVCICGSDIIPVVLAAEKYSGYDISEIRKQIEVKRIWYKENCYDDYYRQFGDNDVDLFEIYATD